MNAIFERVLKLLSIQRSPKEETMDIEIYAMSPEQKARLNESTSQTEALIDASKTARKSLDKTPSLLKEARHRATGVIGTDLLADRPGRPNQYRRHPRAHSS